MNSRPHSNHNIGDLPAETASPNNHDQRKPRGYVIMQQK